MHASQLNLRYHPDRHQGDKQKEEKFKQISEAYSVLSNDTERKKYDYQNGGGYYGGGSGSSTRTSNTGDFYEFHGAYAHAGMDDLEDLFGKFQFLIYYTCYTLKG